MNRGECAIDPDGPGRGERGGFGGRSAGRHRHDRVLGPAAVRRQTLPPHPGDDPSARASRPWLAIHRRVPGAFPRGTRAAEIEQLRADLQCQSLRQELGGKVRTLTDREQAYLGGMKLAEQGQWPDAAARFQQVVEGLEPRVLSAADRGLLDRPGTCGQITALGAGRGQAGEREGR